MTVNNFNSLSIQKFLKDYAVAKRASGISEQTIKRVIGDVSYFSREMRLRSVQRITTDTILLWGGRKIAEGKRNSTVSTFYNSIRSFLAFVQSLGIEVGVDLERIRCKASYERRRILKPYQVRRVIACTEDPVTATLVRLIYTTAARRAEALSLTEHMVRTSQNYTVDIVGKGNKPRPIFINERLYNELLENAVNGFCFTNSRGEQLTGGQAYARVKKAMIMAGYPWADIHTLRHSSATVLLSRGADVSQVSRILGHTNIATTQIYVHLVTSDIQRTHRKFMPAV